MGGYGALKLALNHPERFAAAGAMSSVTDIAAKFGDPRYAGWQFEDIFGSPELLASDGNDLFASLDKSAKLTTKPRIIQICGTEDYLWQDNLKLKEAFEKNNYSDYVFESHPGAHSWDFWDLYIQTILKFFFQQ
jgi:putative lysine transport system ATP-binding protein